MKKILFLAPFFTDNKDGFNQRITSIDTLFADTQRCYLQLSYRSFFIPSIRQYEDGRITAIRANVLTGFYLILYHLFRCDLIYSHTIYNLSMCLLYFPFFKRKVVLDVHGVVPEEQLYMGNKKEYNRFDKIEAKCFRRIDTAIVVTDAMKKFYQSKYPGFKGEYVVYGIIPNNLLNHGVVDTSTKPALYQRFNIQEKDTVIVYSGGLHKWQNIDEMLLHIQQNLKAHYKYILLTNEVEEMKKKLNHIGLITEDAITVTSVKPEELRSFYEIAHYGFVLRDDSVVNWVANPTKMVEYLTYGITPITKSPKIGDFEDMGYEYIAVNSLKQLDLLPRKSTRNEQIAQQIIRANKDISWVGKLLKDLK